MSVSTTSPVPGHDASGRFARGNPGGPGNPGLRRTAMMKKAIAQAVTVEEVAAVFRAIVAKALEGSFEAGRLVLHYTVGKPDMFHAALGRMDDDVGELAPPPAPASAPAPSAPAPAAPVSTVSARRDSSHLLRRDEREPSTEELLGLSPRPFANGGNGPASVLTKPSASTAAEPAAGRPGGSRSHQK